MAKFLIQLAYSAEGAKGLRKDGGTKRVKVVSKAVESIGGKVESFYFSFGRLRRRDHRGPARQRFGRGDEHGRRG
jgi:hypothetical protein